MVRPAPIATALSSGRPAEVEPRGVVAAAPALGELARRAGAGDRAAFTGLVAATHRVVHALIARLTAGAAEVDDVVQETYARAWQGLPRLREPDAALGFVCGIARHLAADAVRRARVMRRAPALAHGPAPLDPAELLAGAQTAALVAEALAALRERHRLILLMREVDQMSYGEIAAALGLPLGTVESRLSRAREALARAVERAARRRKLDPATLRGRP